MVTNAVFLLESLVVFFIDNDQAQVPERQEKRRARADDYLGIALRDPAP